jgi:hypothetical protein
MSMSTEVKTPKGQKPSTYFDDEDIPVIKYALRNGATMAERTTDNKYDPIRGIVTADWLAKSVDIVVYQDTQSGFFVVESNRMMPRNLTESRWTKLADVMAEVSRLTPKEVQSAKVRTMLRVEERFPSFNQQPKSHLNPFMDEDAEKERWTDCGHGNVEGQYETVATGTIECSFTSLVWPAELTLYSVRPRNKPFYELQVSEGTLHPKLQGQFRKPSDIGKALDKVTQEEGTPLV